MTWPGLIESDYLPTACGRLFDGPWLILAPHPDDETFGMGGSIALALAAGIEVEIVVLTDGKLGGSAQDLKENRERETRHSVTVLGGATIHFWQEPDRGLVPDQPIIERVVGMCEGRRGGTCFFPGLAEPHPDHRATAVIAWEALRQSNFPMQPVSYDISVQGLCNRLIDISPVIVTKQAAMSCHQSQVEHWPYIERVLAVNASRAWSLPSTVSHAESFCALPCLDVPLERLLADLQEPARRGVSRSGALDAVAVNRCDVEIIRLKSEIAALRASTSWRLTAPVRSLAMALRKGIHCSTLDANPAAGAGRRKTVLFVLASTVLGGAEVQTRTLLEGLSGRFELVLLTHESFRAYFAALEGSGALRFVTFESQGLQSPFDYRTANFLAYSRAISLVARRVDASLVHGVMHNASLFISVARWRHWRSMRGRKLTGSLHGALTGYFEQRGAGPTWVEHILIKTALRSLDKIVTPSEGVAHELYREFGASEDRLAPIYNGFDLAVIRDKALEPIEVAPEGRWIVTCCRLSDQKDLGTLVKAVSQISSEYEMHLIVVGDGPERQNIESLVNDFGLSDRVHFVGFQDNPYKWIARADVFVLSSFYEGFGNVIVEAMALGVPVLASDCRWGPAEIICSEDSGGMLFPVGAVGMLVDQIRRLASDEQLRGRLGLAARKRAEHFSAERMSEAYTSLFKGLVPGEPDCGDV